MHLPCQLFGIYEAERGGRTFTADTLIPRHYNISQLLFIFMHNHIDMSTPFNRYLFSLHTDKRNFQCVGFFHHFTGEISFDIGNSSKRAVDSPDIRTRQRIPFFIHYPPFDVPDFTSSRYRLHSTDSDKMLFHLIFKRFPFQYFLKCRQRSQLAYTDTYPICADICTRKIHLITGHIAELLQSLSQWRFL